MSNKVVPIGLNKKHLTKAEKTARSKAEASLRPGTDKVKPPTWLSSQAKREFNRIVKEFGAVEADLLTNVDVDLLATYCDAYVLYKECTKIVQDEGLMVEYTNKAGAENVVPHPLLTKKKAAFDQMRACAIEFGLTPSARARLALPKEPDKPATPFESLFGSV